MKKILILLVVVSSSLWMGCNSSKKATTEGVPKATEGEVVKYPLRRDSLLKWSPNEIMAIQYYLGAGFDLVSRGDSGSRHVENGIMVYKTVPKVDIIHLKEGTECGIIEVDPGKLWVRVQCDHNKRGKNIPAFYIRTPGDGPGILQLRANEEGYVPYLGLNYEPSQKNAFLEFRARNPIDPDVNEHDAEGYRVGGDAKTQ